MSGSIHLGYVVGTGEPVEIPLRHTAVTGQTQESGKTTTLEGLISRSGLQAVAYVTKRGESSFHVMNPIPPYFQERADWKFVQSLLEASTETKLKFEQAWIMRASEGARTLQDVRNNIQRFIKGVRDTRPVKSRKGAEIKERWLHKPARGMSGDIYYVLDKYLDDIMPQLAEMPYTTELDLADGLNVMDLRDYEFPLQALVVRSVTDYIRQHLEGTINIIPEAWKMAPKQRGSPVRLAAEEYVREAAAMKNYLWIDSQDLAGVADVLMRQVGVWLFGVQRAKHEIERALDHMPEGLPVRRPRPADVATLSKGQFFVCFGREMHKVYVQPAWMTAAHAEAIARGEEEVDSARDILKEYDKGAKHASNKISSTSRAQNRSGTPADVRKSEDVSVSRMQSQQDSEAGRSGPAPDRSTQRGNDSASPSGKEEAMWKEKYETLKAEFEKLKVAYDKSYIPLRGAPGEPTYEAPSAAKFDLNGNLDDIYRFVRGKLAQEIQSGDGLLAHVLMDVPELKVTRQRRTLQMSDTETPGRIAILIADKFFDSPQQPVAVLKEFKRRGWFSQATPSTNLFAPLNKITEMGFLTCEGKDYQAVPGMKVNIVEV